MNSVALVGRMVADAEMKYGKEGTTIAGFRVAVQRKFKKEGQPEADFITCKAFEKTADFIEKYFKKGMKIGLTGSIQTGSYQNKEGKTVYTTEVMVDNVEFVESKAAQEEPKGSMPKPNYEDFMSIPDNIDEELPFK